MDIDESLDSQPTYHYVTPVELRQTKFGRTVRGYDPDEVDALLARVRDCYAQLYKERLELAVEVKTLEAEVIRLDADQNLIRDVLIDAKRTADELRADAVRDGEVIREDAREQAAAIVREAELEAEVLRQELQQLRDLERDMRAGYRAFLLAALELVEATPPVETVEGPTEVAPKPLVAPAPDEAAATALVDEADETLRDAGRLKAARARS
jgi:cell division initiation protein